MTVVAKPAVRVIKLGGSLLSLAPLKEHFDAWLAAQVPATNIIIVGGGVIVDALRDIDRVQSLDKSLMHWLAIDAMSTTAQLAACLLERPLTDQLAALIVPAGATTIFDVRPFLRQEEWQVDRPRLPCCWEVTSDSIAAHIALVLEAAELVLLKSALPAGGTTLAHVAQSGYVDAYFPSLAARLPRVRCVDLQRKEIPEALLGDF